MTMMTYPIRLVVATAVLTMVAAAQEASPAPSSPASTPAPAPAAPASANDPVSPLQNPNFTAATAPAPAAPKRPRAVSSEVAAIMATGMPKYNPPPKPVEKKPEEDVDLRDVDKPKNGIVRLPAFKVQGNRVPIFRERDLYTEKGLSKIAMERNPGLNVPLIGFMNRPIALQMYRDDQRLSDIDDLRKAASDAQAAGDTAGSDYIRRTAAETFVRRSDFGTLDEKKP